MSTPTLDKDGIELRLGRWQDVLADVGEVDAVVTDPPYGARTHSRQEHGRHKNQSGTAWVTRRGLGYEHWSHCDVSAFVGWWAPRCRGWLCAMTSHDLVEAWSSALCAVDRYVFAPLPIVQRGMNVRLAGDGPSSWTVWLVVSRTRSMSRWGTLPGAYVGTAVDPGEMLADKANRPVAGGKPLWLTRAIIRDYTRPGDLIVDPCAGGATTLLAARLEGRRAIGAEQDPDTHAKAMKRIKAGYTPQFDFAQGDQATHGNA